jgi:hypothetical protein
MKIGFSGLLFVVFLVLKLIDKINWSWWCVTSPLWISFLLWTLVFVMVFAAEMSQSPLQRRIKSVERSLKKRS